MWVMSLGATSVAWRYRDKIRWKRSLTLPQLPRTVEQNICRQQSICSSMGSHSFPDFASPDKREGIQKPGRRSGDPTAAVQRTE